eukprot:1978832-Pyramimonas_sp.AAC.1
MRPRSPLLALSFETLIRSIRSGRTHSPCRSRALSSRPAGGANRPVGGANRPVGGGVNRPVGGVNRPVGGG